MGLTPRPTPGPALGGDEEHLFRTHHRRLLRLVARDVTARPQVIEDACAFAWLELVARQPQRTNVVGWLRVVARHEAIRLATHDRRFARTAARPADAGMPNEPSAGSEALEALYLLAALPARKRAVLTLQVAGYSYRETAARLSMSERTVERQLQRARAAVRHARDEAGELHLAA
jgi:RNA polymerase sigma factor (sigma-70 family)